jgi:hypothetical protein
MLHGLFLGPVSDEFHYSEKFGTTDTRNGRAEYLHVTGSGRIQCDQNLIADNQVRLDISLHIRAVTVKCDEIVWQHRIQLTGSQFLGDLQWHDVRALTF